MLFIVLNITKSEYNLFLFYKNIYIFIGDLKQFESFARNSTKLEVFVISIKVKVSICNQRSI